MDLDAEPDAEAETYADGVALRAYRPGLGLAALPVYTGCLPETVLGCCPSETATRCGRCGVAEAEGYLRCICVDEAGSGSGLTRVVLGLMGVVVDGAY